MVARIRIMILAVFVCLCWSAAAHAHQPRISFGAKHSFFNPVVIRDPEVSKAYYGLLAGQPDYYRIDSRAPYQLYLNILVPDLKDSRLDMNVDVISDNKTLLSLKSRGYQWERFFEPFARDHYLKGPELDWRLRQGTYFIKVYNKGNTGKYSLAVGKIESYSPPEVVKMAFTLPAIKADFFNKPAYSAFLTPVGLIMLIYLVVLTGIVFGLVFLIRRFIYRRIKTQGLHE